MKVENILEIPKELSSRDRKLFNEFDAVESITKLIDELAVKRPHIKISVEWNPPRRPFVLHPSSVDNPCDFYLYLQMVGGNATPKKLPPASQAIMNAGTVTHGLMQYYMEARVKLNKGSEFKSEVGFNPKTSVNAHKLKMAGHIDGVSIGWPLVDSPLIWEFKSISKHGFEKLTSPAAGYVKQVYLYMLALGIPVAIILYICRDNAQVKAYKIEFDVNKHRDMLERILRIRECAKNLVDPEKRVRAGCTRCEFFGECNPNIASYRSPGYFPRKF